MINIYLYLKATGYNKFSRLFTPIVITLFISLLEIFSLGLLYPLLQFFMDRESFAQSHFMKILNSFIPALSLTQASFLVLFLFLGITIFRSGVAYLGYKLIFNQIALAESQFASKEFKKLLFRNYLYFVNNSSTKMIRSIAIAIPQGFSATLQSLIILFSEVFVLLGMALFLLLASYEAFLGLTLLFGGAAFFYVRFISPKIVHLGIERHNNSHKCIGVIQQCIEGIQQIKNACSEKYFANIFSLDRVKQAQISANLQLFQILPKIYFETLMVICMCGFLSYCLLENNHNMSISFVTIGFYAVTAFRLLPSVLRISAQYNNIISYKEAIKVIISLAQEDLTIESKKVSSYSFKDKLLLKDIAFQYDEQWVLKDLNLQISKNKCIGIFGKSGQGKTTFVNILAGLLYPAKGEIQIDSVNVSHHDIKQKLGNMIAYVPQNTYLLDESLRSNVAFGEEEESIDNQRVMRALEGADLQELINTRGEGMDLKIGERGVRISGGQRQRIGIARALYLNRDIIVFDEATSSLDEATENKICQTIQALKNKKTIIIISHRKKPLSICDEVYEMKSGCLKKVKI